MRGAFFALLFANLLFMAWAGWVDTSRQMQALDANARLPRLKLVSEAAPIQQGNQGAVHKMALIAPGEGSFAPSAQVTRCVSLGPFNDIEVAAKAAGALQARGFAPQQRAAAGETRDGYWVYIGGVTDAASADRIFRTLEGSGIKDASLMPESSDGRRISVGLFSERERAERRAKAVQRLGFKADLEDHTQPGTVYWVDLMLKAHDQAVPVQDLLSAGSANTRLSVQSCPPQPAAPPTPGSESVPAEPAPGSRVPSTTVAGTPKLP